MKLIKRYHKWKINREQEKVNKLMESEGFSNEVLEKQIEVNRLRHKHGIVDEDHLIYDKYVQ